ncbi:Hypothetical protein LUCI_4803 [Lucifera butyrica]|uniref:Uncharacterized protein n=1 Tax=Lucifera butyrica TaxID=1351585 RepID=A0A498RKD5_9FIRM|nr:Hypothetical protein LUCI_4803 [Lucifera butyrica]
MNQKLYRIGVMGLIILLTAGFSICNAQSDIALQQTD